MPPQLQTTMYLGETVKSRINFETRPRCRDKTFRRQIFNVLNDPNGAGRAWGRSRRDRAHKGVQNISELLVIYSIKSTPENLDKII